MGRTVYYGGPILTMDPAAPRAEAMLTENGRILALGSYASLSGANARRVDLGGCTLLPGFVDGHSHMVGHGIQLTQNCDLSKCSCMDDLLTAIRDFRQKKGLFDGQPIVARGYDPAVMTEGRHPTAGELDSLGFCNPISCIHTSGHVAVYNTLAMERAGVLTPKYTAPAGGFAQRDENGRLTGYFEETAKAPFAQVFARDFSQEDLRQAVLAAQADYVRNGYTTVQEGSGNGPERLALLSSLGRQGLLQVDVMAYMHINKGCTQYWDDALDRYGPTLNRRVRVSGIKMFLDGSPQARTAWLRQPYEGSAGDRSYPTLSQERTREAIVQALSRGLQPMAHCNGDAACEQFLSAWEQLGDHSTRPVMVHAQFVGYDQLERMAKGSMMASFFVGHCWYWGDTHLKNTGHRAMRISPCGKALALGIPFSLHQDCPVTPPNMLHSIWCATNRITREGVRLDADCRLEAYEALRAATWGGAYTYGEEDRRGVLKPGALADLVVLDRDPTAVDPAILDHLRVLQTIKEDQTIYKAVLG